MNYEIVELKDKTVKGRLLCSKLGNYIWGDMRRYKQKRKTIENMGFLPVFINICKKL